MAKIINLNGRNYLVINPNTERAQGIIRAFRRSNEVDLDDAYGRYSGAKVDGYEYCRKLERI